MRGMMVILGAGVAASSFTTPLRAAADAPASDSEIVVNGTVASQVSVSATGLPLSVAETPQAISIINQDQIRKFALTDVNALLDQVPGVNVERNETDRTEYD